MAAFKSVVILVPCLIRLCGGLFAWHNSQLMLTHAKSCNIFYFDIQPKVPLIVSAVHIPNLDKIIIWRMIGFYAYQQPFIQRDLLWSIVFVIHGLHSEYALTSATVTAPLWPIIPTNHELQNILLCVSASFSCLFLFYIFVNKNTNEVQKKQNGPKL